MRKPKLSRTFICLPLAVDLPLGRFLFPTLVECHWAFFPLPFVYGAGLREGKEVKRRLLKVTVWVNLWCPIPSGNDVGYSVGGYVFLPTCSYLLLRPPYLPFVGYSIVVVSENCLSLWFQTFSIPYTGARMKIFQSRPDP